MSEKIATREAYGKALAELGNVNDKVVVLDADLAGATMTKHFKAAHPERFFDCGIAEADMVDISAGLSTMGLIPFCSTSAMFGAGRAYEQIRNSIAVTTSCSRMEGMLSASAMRAVSDSGMSSPCRIRAESCSKESVMSSPVFCVDKLSYYYRHGEENCQTGRLIFWLWRDTLSE